MRYVNSFLTFSLLAALLLTSCVKDNADLAKQAVSKDVLNKIAAMGFSTENVLVVDEGYLVEGDIVITHDQLGKNPASPLLRIAETEQYRTFELVDADPPRVITISTTGKVNARVSQGINEAIIRYNAENLAIAFQRVSSGGDINIRIVNGGGYIASAGFPSGGNPYPEVKFNRTYQNYSLEFVTTVIAHEIGHCIGFRHTDYMNRSFSCGTGGNEGQETTGVGAVHIPGTPTGPDSGSWMLACLSSTTDRPFNNNDKTALNYLY